MSSHRPRIFDVFNFKYYPGANPYLNTTALVFDLVVLDAKPSLALSDYLHELGRGLPQVKSLEVNSYGELFIRTAVAVSKLDMGLHFERYGITPLEQGDRLALHSLHEETSQGVVILVRDWLEAIARGISYDLASEIARLQQIFSDSIYGGPTAYSLLQSAYRRGIPFFYLPDERLMQYGYGKYQVRGASTTFDLDSQLDSNFTTFKDDCKAFIHNCGFPVPQGRTVYNFREAREAAAAIAYPVAVKPVVGHKGIGVTADVRDERGLEFAFEKAKEATREGHSAIIVEQHIAGSDFRLLCVGGRFVAALERRPPYVTGDGRSAIAELIERENATKARLDTPTSALGKIITDDVMDEYLKDRELSVDSVIESGRVVYLRRVANLSSGGVSVDATETIHPDNAILAQDIARYFRLVCLGIDVMSGDLSKSWKEGNFGVIEINSAPGVYMHLNPAVGKSVDVPGAITDYLFPSQKPCRIPTIAFNRLYRHEVYDIADRILLRHPNWTIGAACRDGFWINRTEINFRADYNSSVRSLLRHPKLDLLIAEYAGEILEWDGMCFEGSNLAILDNPSPVERTLLRDLLPDGTAIVRQGSEISVQIGGFLERHSPEESESFNYVYLREINRLIANYES